MITGREPPRFYLELQSESTASVQGSLTDLLLSLPRDHPYVQMELDEMREQLENEARISDVYLS